MLVAAFCTAFHGFLRVSEFMTPSSASFDPSRHTSLKDLRQYTHHFKFNLKWTKTDKSCRGQVILLPARRGPTHPYTALAKYLQSTHSYQSSMAPLFLLRDGHYLTAKQFRFHLKHLLKRAGYYPNCYNTHSFQIGAATSAARAGVPTTPTQNTGKFLSRTLATWQEGLCLVHSKSTIRILEGGFRFRRITVIACIQVRGSRTLWSGRIIL